MIDYKYYYSIINKNFLLAFIKKYGTIIYTK